MRSLLGRFHRPFARSADEQLLSLNNLGDGSTLSLDFTTGVLDPRLTFTRLSNATFINSSGLVEWANANMYWNTAFEGLSGTNPTLGAGTGWAYVWSNAGTTAVFTDGQSVTISATADRRSIGRSSGFTGNALRTITVVDVEVLSGNLTPPNVITGTNTVGAEWYVNGSLWSSGNLPTTPCTVAFVANTATPGTTTVHFGVGANGTATGSVRFSNPRWTMWNGSVTVPYYPNTSATNSPSANYFKSNDYQAPRFDYDPTSIGTPRGLLIEGSANNLCTYSGDMTQSGAGHWSVRTALVTTSWTGFTAPDGTASAVKIIPDTTSSRHTLESSSTTITSGLVYTASAFVKADGYSVASLVVAGGQTRRNFTLSGNGTAESQFGLSNTATITPVGSSGWYRVTMTWTANITGSAGFWIGVPQNASTDVVTAWSGNGTSGIQAWGAQLEAGSGASSYIPTGASTGNRAADFCYQDGISSWFTSQSSLTMLVDATPRVQTSFPILWILTDAGGGNSYQVYYTSSGTTNSYTTKVIVGFSGTSESTLASSVQQDTRQIIGYAIASGVGVRSRNGVSGTAAVPTSLPTTALTRLGVGSTGSGFPANAHIRRIKYWPYALTQNQLNGATTT